MLLTISTTHTPATDLGYLLHKNPNTIHNFDLPFGTVHVFYPQADENCCTVAILLDVDPVSLVRGRKDSRTDGNLDQYVNDRPYVASSFMSVAIAQVFRTALSGKCKDRPELAQQSIPLTATIAAVECRGGSDEVRRLFEPLGYALEISSQPLDETFAKWGDSRYFKVTLRKICPLSELLAHLYVLIPVMDNEKHYWVGEEEVEKLLRHGDGWLNEHPERNFIAGRYLDNKRHLTKLALQRLTDGDELDPDEHAQQNADEEAAVERPISLNERRLGAVISVLRDSGARRIIDLGCGEGRLVGRLFQEKEFEEITGMDVSFRALEIAQERLKVERMSERQKARLNFIHGSLTYRDKRFEGYDAATCIEVIEHLDPPRLSAFERVLFDFAKPKSVILTTPNVEYNVNFPNLPAGKFRHRDHRFEWSRSQFQTWAQDVCTRYKYDVRFLPIGDEDAEHGSPTQMGVFTR